MCFVFFFSFILVDGFFNSAHKIFGVWSDKWSVCALSDFVDLFQFLSSLRSLQINILLLLFFFVSRLLDFQTAMFADTYLLGEMCKKKEIDREREMDGSIEREREKSARKIASILPIQIEKEYNKQNQWTDRMHSVHY